MVLDSDLAGNLAKAHIAHCSMLLINTTAAALESKAALGLPISENPTAENATTDKRVEVMLDPSALERILCGGGATPGRQWVDAGATVALDPQGHLGIGHPQQSNCGKHNNIYRGRGCAWFEILGTEIARGAGRLLAASGLMVALSWP